MGAAQDSLEPGGNRLKNVFDQRVLQVLQPLTAGLVLVFALALAANLAEGLPERAVAPLVSIKRARRFLRFAC